MNVSFDFDNTLTMTQWSDEDGWFFKDAGPNLVMVQCMHAHIAMGNKVHIITSRFESTKSKTDILRLLSTHGLGTKVSGIHFTDGELKANQIIELDISRHFDDDPEELAALPAHCAGVLINNTFLDRDGCVCDPLDPQFFAKP